MLKNKFLKIGIFFFCIFLANVHALNLDEIKNNALKEVKIINTNELVTLLEKSPNTKIIDVREKDEILRQGGYIKANKVTNISRANLEFLIQEEVKEDETFIVHCFNGNKSLFAAKRLKDLGYKNVLYYKDSFKVWKDRNLPISSKDFYINSFLYNPVKEVSKGVYTSIGATQPATYENSGHNNNLGFVIGDDSILVWNAGANYLLAKSFHEEIKKISNKPIKYVVLENSQGHAMLGSSYWKEQGASIISHEIAKQEIMQKGENILSRHQRTYRDKALSTKIIIPDETFKESMSFDLGNRVVEAKYFGYAHEHSDIAIWLEKEKILFTGDLAFHQRMLPIFKITDTRKWLEAWEKLALLDAQIVIPGHGDVTDMPTVTKYTKGYLEYLREKVGEALDEGKEAYEVDQSPYAHLDTFKELAKQNASRLYEMMEFEE